MSEPLRLTDNERAELYDPNRRMSAYYFEFQPTGAPAVDAILSAVAVAGKSAHNTDQWTEDECDDGWCPRWGDGRSLVDVIQAAANEAAIELWRLREDVRSYGRTIDRWGQLIIDATDSRSLVGDTGDGDWGVIEERLAALGQDSSHITPAANGTDDA